MRKTPIRVSLFHGLSPIAQPGRFHTRSNSHSVAVRNGCTNIPLAAGGTREDETILQRGFFRAIVFCGSSARIDQK